jgi:hypothetical protein
MVTTNEKFKPLLLVPKQIDPSLHAYITNLTDNQDIAVELIEHPNKNNREIRFKSSKTFTNPRIIQRATNKTTKPNPLASEPLTWHTYI